MYTVYGRKAKICMTNISQRDHILRLYNTVCYSTVLDTTWYKDGSKNV